LFYKAEVWAMLQGAKLLKHKILILLYGCGLVAWKRSVRLQDLDFDSNNSK
jgi:hypothetical protein